MQPASVIPKVSDPKILVCNGTKGNIFLPKFGISISIVGADTIGGLSG